MKIMLEVITTSQPIIHSQWRPATEQEFNDIVDEMADQMERDNTVRIHLDATVSVVLPTKDVVAVYVHRKEDDET